MSDPVPSLKQRTAEFIKAKGGKLRKDVKEVLVSYIEGVMQGQDPLIITTHRDEDGKIDCACLSDLCAINLVPTEEVLGCQRLEMLVVGTQKKSKRKRQEDHVVPIKV